MGRPRKNTSELTAMEKAENAFWDILAKGDLRRLSVSNISKEAGLNRNSIYYHYENIDDIVRSAVEHTADDTTVAVYLNALLSGNIDAVRDSGIFSKAEKIGLLAGSDSPVLRSVVKEKILNSWSEHFQIRPDRLSSSDRLQLDFIASGIISMIGSASFFTDSGNIRDFSSSLIGQAAIKTLQQFADRE